MSLEISTQTEPANQLKPEPAAAPLYSLTSLRFFGSLAVFFYHAIEICKRESQVVVFGSASAVSLFFVLSGFILVYIYQRKMSDLGFWGFYAKRFARLWPLHVACLLLVLIFQWNLLSYPRSLLQPEFLAKLGTNLLMLQSLVPSPNWSLSFNGVSWFVSTEFCFCLLFPFLIRKTRSGMVLVWIGTGIFLLAGLAISNYILLNHPEWRLNIFNMIQCNPFFRLFEFTSGMLVATIFINGFRLPSGQKLGWFWLHALVEAVAIAFLVVSIHQGVLAQWLYKTCANWEFKTAVNWLGRGGSSLPASMLLIWVLASSKGPLASLLAQPFLVHLGKLSYSFYMIHLVVLNLVVKHSSIDVSPTVMILAALIFSIAAASWLNLLVETPFRSLLLRILDRRSIGAASSSFTAQPWKKAVYSTAVVSLIALLGVWALKSDSSGKGLYIPSDVNQIAFQESTLLHYVNAEMKEDELEITLIWEKLGKFEGTRFGHIILPDKQFRLLPANSLLFKNNRIGIELIKISKSQLDGALGVGVGWLKNGQSIPFTTRTRSIQGSRLMIYDCVKNSVPSEVSANLKKKAVLEKR